MSSRNSRSRNVSAKVKGKRASEKIIQVDHNYSDISGKCIKHKCKKNCSNNHHAQIPRTASHDSWKHGRRTIELGLLLQNLRSCSECRMGPIPLTELSVVGELRKGYGGYLFVRCENIDCRFVNRVAYGKIPRLKKTRMPAFAANTREGVAMTDSSGGSEETSNFQAIQNVKSSPKTNVQRLQHRAGQFVEAVAESSSLIAAQDAVKQEMSDSSAEESDNAASQMLVLIEDLGVDCMPDASPAAIKNFTSSVVFESPYEDSVYTVIKAEQGSEDEEDH